MAISIHLCLLVGRLKSVSKPDIKKTIFQSRCPKCQSGHLFETFLNFGESCKKCGFPINKHDSGDGPAFFIIFFMGFIVVGLALYIEALYAPPLWVHFTIWPIFIFSTSIVLLRYAKACMIYLLYKNDQFKNDS